jgi:type III polyketide synthase
MPNGRHDLAEVAREGDPDGISIVAALFSDAAGAVVLCNEVALAEDREGGDADNEDEDEEEVRPVYRLLQWGYDVIPGTIEHMGFTTEGDGCSSSRLLCLDDMLIWLE